MNGLQVFTYAGTQVRAVEKDGEPWFVLKDVCDVLRISNSRNVVERLDEDEKGVHLMDTPGGEQQMTIINESGLYNVILRSDKPEAKPFRKWVTSEVLPSIRRTGRYVIPESEDTVVPLRLPTMDDYLTAARLLAGCRTDRLSLVVAMLDQAGFDIDEKGLPRNPVWRERSGVKIDTTDIAPFLQEAMEKLKITSLGLAEITGIDAAVMRSYLTGRRFPRAARYTAIKNALISELEKYDEEGDDSVE
ncbi:MAG: hypothetical protein IJK23_05600 [Clostridia bacterium]|nr:hypothetical protein [Clostridia bacterium]